MKKLDKFKEKMNQKFTEISPSERIWESYIDGEFQRSK